MERNEQQEYEQYGTIYAWEKELSISSPAIKKRLENIQGITGRASSGNVIKNGFYPESVVRAACADLLQDVPRADKSGFFVQKEEKDDERYGTIEAWKRELGISDFVIKKRLENIQGITGKDFQGKVYTNAFYPESTVRKECADLLQDILQADASGFFRQEGGGNNERYGHAKAWAQELEISARTIKNRLKNIQVSTRFADDGFEVEGILPDFSNRVLSCDSLNAP